MASTRARGYPVEGRGVFLAHRERTDLGHVHHLVSPTVFREKGFRFFFFSREESRPHIHVNCGHGEAKFWLEPTIELAANKGLKSVELAELQRIVEERRHFGT